jgi:hypothetical protein
MFSAPRPVTLPVRHRLKERVRRHSVYGVQLRTEQEERMKASDIPQQMHFYIDTELRVLPTCHREACAIQRCNETSTSGDTISLETGSTSY